MQYLRLDILFNVDRVLDEDKDLSSSIRGIWGRALKSLFCVTGTDSCEGCEVENCGYAVLFESKESSSEQYRPYVIQAKFMPPAHVYARFKFFGWVSDHYQVLIQSIIRLDGEKLFLDGGACTLSLMHITDVRKSRIYERGDSQFSAPRMKRLVFKPEELSELTLELITPLRQKSGGKLSSSFQWEPFAKSLIGRVRYVNEHYNQRRLSIPQRIDIEGVSVKQSRTFWSEKIRKSLRQNSKMSLGGLLGTVTLEGVSPEMAAILKLGQYLHAGKQCSFGNGEYRVRKMSDALAISTYK